MDVGVDISVIVEIYGRWVRIKYIKDPSPYGREAIALT